MPKLFQRNGAYRAQVPDQYRLSTGCDAHCHYRLFDTAANQSFTELVQGDAKIVPGCYDAVFTENIARCSGRWYTEQVLF